MLVCYTIYMYKQIISKTALHKNDTPYTPYSYDLNIYRGCEHKCTYCYAVYSHKYLDDADFFNNIYFKSNIDQVLDEQLSSGKFDHEIIGIGTVCDSYQPIEEQTNLTSKCLDVFIKHKTSICLSTKSPLVLKDIEKLKKLSELTPISIAMTIISPNQDLIKLLEPNTVCSQTRFETLKTLKQNTSALVGINLMPIIPFITDSPEDIEEIYKMAKQLELDFVVTDVLNLYGETRKSFLNFIKHNFADKYDKIKRLYSSSKALAKYRKDIRAICREIRIKHNFENKYIRDFVENNRPKQLSLL